MKNVKESLDFVKRFLPVVKSYVVRNIRDIKPEFPLVLKIVSSKHVHKTEVKGVQIVKSQNELEKAFKSLKKKSSEILVQDFVDGSELIIGIKQDSSFGHVVMFGIGGVFVELLKDVSFRVCPVSEKDVESMINDLQAKDLLFGFRDKKPVSLNLLKKIIVKVSKIPEKYPNLKELDINPLIINDKKAFAVDARLELG